MSVSPDEFLWLTIVSGFSFIFTTLFLYLWCFPCHCRPRFPSFYQRKRKLSIEGKFETTKLKPNSTCHNCLCLGCGNPQSLPPIPRSPVIKGPQGHGFYTSGPWKIDSMQDSLAMQLSQPNFLMAEYFNPNCGGINPSAPPAIHDESHPPPFAGHLMNNIMLANSSSPAYWNDGMAYVSEETGVSNSNGHTMSTMASSDSLMDIDAQYHETDADMMMMFM